MGYDKMSNGLKNKSGFILTLAGNMKDSSRYQRWPGISFDKTTIQDLT